MNDNDFQTFTFTFTDYDGVECSLTRKSPEGFFWPDILKDAVKVIEKAFGYEIAHHITIKGVNMADPYHFVTSSSFNDFEDENFPEAKSGLTD